MRAGEVSTRKNHGGVGFESLPRFFGFDEFLVIFSQKPAGFYVFCYVFEIFVKFCTGRDGVEKNCTVKLFCLVLGSLCAGEVSTPKNHGGVGFESLPQKTCFGDFLSTKVTF